MINVKFASRTLSIPMHKAPKFLSKILMSNHKKVIVSQRSTMDQKVKTYLLLVLIFPIVAMGQNKSAIDSLYSTTDSLKKTSVFKKMILPAALTGTALVINKSTFEKDLQPRVNRDLSTNIDDYTRLFQ